MATPVDDLEPGMWIAVVDTERHKLLAAENGRMDFNGRPAKIVAISLPFIAVDCDNTVGALDIRSTSVQRVTNAYVEAMTGIKLGPPKRSRKKEHCPLCASMMKSTSKGWFCDECKIYTSRTL